MYSDEIIKQELKRYAVTNSPDVSDDEVARWKETFVNLDYEKNETALKYLFGRSWFWGKLMQSLSLPENCEWQKVPSYKLDTLEFEIGIQVAMRMLGKPIQEAKAVIEPFESKTKKKTKHKNH